MALSLCEPVTAPDLISINGKANGKGFMHVKDELTNPFLSGMAGKVPIYGINWTRVYCLDVIPTGDVNYELKFNASPDLIFKGIASGAGSDIGKNKPPQP
jgi:hypothetical protein